jgi:outer membrane protein, heavy metal efflux system
MHPRHSAGRKAWPLIAWASPPALVLCAALLPAAALAQPSRPPGLTLQQAYAAAWARQPEAASLAARREAAASQRRAADGWAAEATALEFETKTDRLHANDGGREYSLALAVPLWLPTERARTAALAEAGVTALEHKLQADRLRVAAALREAWWGAQRAMQEHLHAAQRVTHVQQLAADVARRVRAGELARSDQFQAEMALAQAEAALAEALALRQSALLALRAVMGADLPEAAEPGPAEPEATPLLPMTSHPRPDRQLRVDPAHPAVAELNARAELSRKAAELSAVKTRANPELMLGTTRERSQFGGNYQQSVTLALRLPLGGGSRASSQVATARAEALEAEVQARLASARVQGEIDAAQARTGAARTRLLAVEKHARLAQEVRGFFEKAFRLGEADLPTRLRTEQEAAEAERQASLLRIEAAAAVSALRQALGLLPE